MSEISAGAITYTMKDHVPFYLLIKDFHGNYGFAKGHLEKGETETQAAIRSRKKSASISDSILPSGKNFPTSCLTAS